jgi:hypothetical protein
VIYGISRIFRASRLLAASKAQFPLRKRKPQADEARQVELPFLNKPERKRPGAHGRRVRRGHEKLLVKDPTEFAGHVMGKDADLKQGAVRL